MPDTPLHYQTIAEVGARLQSLELSPVELTSAILERIEALDGDLKSYATVMADSALASARIAEQEIAAGNYRGGLHGVPIAVKDLCFTTGVATMGGARVLRDFVPDFDGTVVQKLNAAGAVILGKLNLTEGAMAGYNPEFQIPVNPMGRRPLVRRFFQRLGSSDCSRTVLWLVGQRHRRLDQVPVSCLRHCGNQAHLGAGEPVRRVGLGRVLGPRWSDDPKRLRRRCHTTSHRGAGPQ